MCVERYFSKVDVTCDESRLAFGLPLSGWRRQDSRVTIWRASREGSPALVGLRPSTAVPADRDPGSKHLPLPKVLERPAACPLDRTRPISSFDGCE